jgi:mannose-6-phosphate isomerase-like protein (cupin superfamily)
MNVRCIVTGRDSSGQSVFVSKDPVAPITLDLLPGLEFHRLWGSDSTPQLPSDGTPPLHPRYFPPAGGFRFGFFTLPPETQSLAEHPNLPGLFAELHAKLHGLADVLEPLNPGMHTTETVDFDVIISGEVYLELDNGSEVLLKPGDCVIQNGTRHAWHNRSTQPCVIAVTLLGAHR